MKSIWKNGTVVATALFGAGLFFGSDGLAIAQTSQARTADARFAREAAMGGMMEVELGKVAVSKATNEKVKQFAQRMIDDHTKAGDKLKEVASKDNVTLPNELDAKHKAMVDRFSSMSGTGFDRAYMRDMVKDHEMDIADFQKEANSGRNADLKNFASSTLPTLQDHLRQAKETENSLGVTSSR